MRVADTILVLPNFYNSYGSVQEYLGSVISDETGRKQLDFCVRNALGEKFEGKSPIKNKKSIFDV